MPFSNSGGLMKCFPPTAFVVGSLCFVFIAIPAYGYTDPNAVGLLSPLLITAGACLTFHRRSPGDAVIRLSRRLRSDV